MKAKFNISTDNINKRAQASKGFWTGVEAFAILVKHHPRAADVIERSHRIMSKGLFGKSDWHDPQEGRIHGFAVYHAENYNPIMIIELSYNQVNDTVYIHRLSFGRNRDERGRARPLPQPEVITAAMESLESTIKKNGLRMCSEGECPIDNYDLFEELKAGHPSARWFI